MHIRLTALALAGACGMALAAGQARADVIYDFIQTSAQGGDPRAPGYPFTGLQGGINLVVTEAAVALGSLDGTLSCFPGGCSGSLPGFVTATDFGIGTVTARLAFDAGGTLSGSLDVNSSPNLKDGDHYTISGSGTSWTGRLLASGNPAYAFDCGNYQPYCTFTGYFASGAFHSPASVPEPASFALLGMGVLGLGLVRGRKRTAA